MKRALVALLAVLFLSGCGQNKELDKAMDLRKQLLEAEGCQFTAVITADYVESVYSFSMECKVDKLGNMQFTVIEPESISGVTGTVSSEGGKLTFDGQLLAFPLMADGLITPVSAPWLFMETLRSGYITACGKIADNMQILIDDSYEENPLRLEVLTDEQCVPLRGEIIWDQRRIVSVAIENFVLL